MSVMDGLCADITPASTSLLPLPSQGNFETKSETVQSLEPKKELVGFLVYPAN